MVVGDSYDAELKKVLSMTFANDKGSPVSEKPISAARPAKVEKLVPQQQKVAAPKKEFKCTWDKCERRFKKRDHMHSHLRQHTGETPYACPVCPCPLRFKWRSSLRNHLRYHDPIGASSPIKTPQSQLKNTTTTVLRQSPPSFSIGPSMAEDVRQPGKKQTPKQTRKRRATAEPTEEGRQMIESFSADLYDLLSPGGCTDGSTGASSTSRRIAAPTPLPTGAFSLPLDDNVVKERRLQADNTFELQPTVNSAIVEIEEILDIPDLYNQLLFR